MDLPDLHVPDHERVPASGPTRSTPSPRLRPYKPSQCDSLSSKRTNGSVRMSTVSARAVGLQDREGQAGLAVRRGLEAEAVAVVLAGDVAGEACSGCWPTRSPAPSFWSNGRTCSGSGFADVRLHGEVAVEDVVDLGAVLEEEAVADALVADAVADDQVVRAVDRDPAVAAVPDRGADDRAAAHRVAERGGSAGCTCRARLPCPGGGTRRSEIEPAESRWYMVWPRTPSGSADSTTTLRLRFATSPR